jgi:hypothetical protein
VDAFLFNRFTGRLPMPLPVINGSAFPATKLSRGRIVKGFQLILAFLTFIMACWTPAKADYASMVSPMGNPISPEARYADDLDETIKVHAQVRINQASLNQLQILPGFDQDLALKVIRLRPFKNIADMNRKMPASSKHKLAVIQNRLQRAVRFD